VFGRGLGGDLPVSLMALDDASAHERAAALSHLPGQVV